MRTTTTPKQRVEWLANPRPLRPYVKSFSLLFLFVLIGMGLLYVLRPGPWTDAVPGIALAGLILVGVLLSSVPRRVGISSGAVHLRWWGRERVVPTAGVVRVDLMLELIAHRFAGGRRVYEPLFHLADGRRVQIGPAGETVVEGLLKVLPIERFWVKVISVGPKQRPQILAEYPLSRERERPPGGRRGSPFEGGGP